MMGLGINKDLEPLVRKVRRLGGSVEITGGTHVRWTMPSGEVIPTGLTMRDTTARNCQRRIEAALDGVVPARPRREVRPNGAGKFIIADIDSGEALRNGNGYARTFGRRAAAAAFMRAALAEEA